MEGMIEVYWIEDNVLLEGMSEVNLVGEECI